VPLPALAGLMLAALLIVGFTLLRDAARKTAGRPAIEWAIANRKLLDQARTYENSTA
jgi:hypothetical protein